jgi:hypothetical protein
MLSSKNLFHCLCLLLFAQAALAQSGDWYTYSTGTAPVCHVKLDDNSLLIERMDPAFRQQMLQGRPGADTPDNETLDARKLTSNGRIYYIFVSADNLYFCTTFQYFKKQDSLVMFCADGIDDGYTSVDQAIDAIKKDTGRHFMVTLYRKAHLDAQRRKQPITKITADEFTGALQQFNKTMDQFWQYRGYGRYEPYHGWMNLIYGNAFANAFDDKYNKLTLDAQHLKTPIAQYGANPDTKKLLQQAGLVSE